MHKSEFEYKILKKFEGNPNLTQRQMAKQLGLSLGKTNYLIRSLLEKGWVKLKNFKTSDDKRGYLYVLTAGGLAEKTKLTEEFLKYKSEEYARLKKEIEVLKKEL